MTDTETAPTTDQDPVPEAASSRVPPLLEAMRPRQWTKNLLVLAGVIFANQLLRSDLLCKAAGALVCFCLLSSSIYLFNDLVDREQDRAHPRKRLRPIASGRLSARTALTAGIVLAVISIGAGFAIRVQFGEMCAGFLALNILYSLWMKHEVILDVLGVAAGFLVRAMAGAEAVNVKISAWLLICTVLLALVISLGKRRQELSSIKRAGEHRRVLQMYSLGLLDQLMTVVVSATLVAYLFYVFQSETALSHRWLPVTAPFVLYGVFRYLFLLHERGAGGAPEDLLFEDTRLRWAVIGWMAAAIIAMVLR